MTVPVYYRSRQGHMFRLQRVQEDAREGMCYRLRAYQVKVDESSRKQAVAEVAQSVEKDALMDKLRRHQAAIPPEQVFDDLWQTLRLELESFSA